MKSILLIRHAKSSWENFSVSDFDRPLNERGKEDAPEMARRMKENNIVPDWVLVSTAKRTRKTAEYFIKQWHTQPDAVHYLDELYLASPATLMNVLKGIPDSVNTVAVIAHNNGLTDFANELCDVKIDNIPTCGIYAVRAAINSWQQIQEADKTFWFFESPKRPNL